MSEIPKSPSSSDLGPVERLMLLTTHSIETLPDHLRDMIKRVVDTPPPNPILEAIKSYTRLIHDLNNLINGVVGYLGFLYHEIRQKSDLAHLKDPIHNALEVAERLRQIQRLSHQAAQSSVLFKQPEEVEQIFNFGLLEVLSDLEHYIKEIDKTPGGNMMFPETKVWLEVIEKGKSLVKGYPELQFETRDLSSVIRRFVERIKPLRASNVKISYELEEGTFVSLDPNRFGVRVLGNLSKNAQDMMEEYKLNELWLHFRVRSIESADGEFIELMVEDNGVGFDEEKIPHLFQEGFTTKEKGSGFGLYNAKRVVEKHGGTIEAMNRDDGQKGARFIIRLPAV